MGRVWRVAYHGNAGYELKCRGGTLSDQKETFDEQRHQHLNWVRFPSPFVSVFTSKYHARNWAKTMGGTLIYEIETNGIQLKHVSGQYDPETRKFTELLIVGDIPEANVVKAFRVDDEFDYSGVYEDRLYPGLRDVFEDQLWDENETTFLFDDEENEYEIYMRIYGIRRERRLLYPQ